MVVALAAIGDAMAFLVFTPSWGRVIDVSSY